MSQPYNICAIVQAGRLEYEALIFTLSFRHHNPDFAGRLILLEPEQGDKWDHDTRVSNNVRRLLEQYGAEIIPFQNRDFGQWYPQGNKIEGLAAMPANEPFVFFDTDTLFTGSIDDVPFDFSRPTASMKRENTWPKVELYGPDAHVIWKSLYDKFGLDFDASQDTSFPHGYWQRYLYFNAGWFFYKDPHEFCEIYRQYAHDILHDSPPELVTQTFDPWLDQVALPLVIHRLGGARNTIPTGLLDGSVTFHYRVISLLYATAPDETVAFLQELVAPNKIKKILKQYEPFKKTIYQSKGTRARDMFDRENLPRKEEVIRKRLKNRNLWER
ncbi:hypothetical protein BFP76_04475 [Amylibacter kogurei]|uniref:Uncharacterized protein n=1 Tax=Paramylibacter kogurei TaxID=1889778 RepID=A0A2G5K4L5_9RHOB|nr:hypothetical protein [Amylibacter kogurei]PIB24466.1 hypothetical protein BFP76_04475 [Amylibacter kogurei]